MRKAFLLSIIVLSTLFSRVHAQPLYADTLLFTTGKTLIGDVLNFPPTGNQVTVVEREQTRTYMLDDIAAIHTEMEKRQLTSPDRRSPYLSTLGSLIFPGVGQFINGQPGAGATHVIIALFSSLGTLAGVARNVDSRGSDGSVIVILVSAGVFVGNYLYSLIDAPLTSIAMNRRADKLYPDTPLPLPKAHSHSIRPTARQSFRDPSPLITLHISF